MENRKKVEVCHTPSLYPQYKKENQIVVVIDVLRATSAMCAAFDNGVKKIIPVATIEEARGYQEEGYIVAAERKGQIVEGFNLGNSPYGFMTGEYKDQTIVITTTNGTRAFHTARDAEEVVIGSLLNLDALSQWLVEQDKDVLCLASGWKDKFCLEDTICAGAFVDNLIKSGKFTTDEDSSIAAKYLYLSAKDNYMAFLKASSHRRRLKALNLNEDIKYCLTPNQTNVIPIRKDNYLVLLK
ncbi:MAG: 2-phosphosulfolactate phosphatase [Flavobacteriales bacterium]|jgi:2-phosphosulfolactate phosphatase|nr:2-phosphosulfolactate phosphatase [Flavobacteriales bacterium]